MTMAATTLIPGFADPVIDSQRMFRAMQTAMSHPGRVVPLPVTVAPPAPLHPAAAAVCLTLVDWETPLWLDGMAQAASGWLRFHCGAPIVPEPGNASFGLIADAATMPDLTAFAAGEDDYPDRSATLIVQVAELFPDGPLRLTGPGIRDVEVLGVAGLPGRFVAQWRGNRVLYPLGIDVLLVSPDAIVGLPRTVAMED